MNHLNWFSRIYYATLLSEEKRLVIRDQVVRLRGTVERHERVRFNDGSTV